MRAGSFNISSYLDKLYENAEDGNLTDKEGLILPDENKKTYDWLKKEYQAGQTEVTVEVSGEGSSFKPGFDLQAAPATAAEFKPGMFGEAKTKDGTPGKPGAPGDTKGGTPAAGEKPAAFGKPANPAEGEKSADGKAPLDSKQGNPNFAKGEGNKPAAPKTSGGTGDIKNNNFGKKPEGEKPEGEEDEDKDEKKPTSTAPGKKPEVKKIDLKTKK